MIERYHEARSDRPDIPDASPTPIAGRDRDHGVTVGGVPSQVAVGDTAVGITRE